MTSAMLFANHKMALRLVMRTLCWVFTCLNTKNSYN